jgi:hypothetical protein
MYIIASFDFSTNILSIKDLCSCVKPIKNNNIITILYSMSRKYMGLEIKEK